MTTSSSKYPINPIYKAFCEQHQKESKETFDLIEKLTPEERLEVFAKIRASFQVARANVPETSHTQLECMEVLTMSSHGGGWFTGNPNSYSKFISDLCIKTHAAVMAVDYSLSPEAKFPVANEQSYAALCWLVEHGRSITVNPDKIAIMGDSAGGNMATVVSMMAKDRNMGKSIKAQALLYPVVTDQDPTKYDSYQKYGQGDCGLSITMTQVCTSSYLPKPISEYSDRYVTPIIASNEQLKGLGPCLILTSECDILRDEGEAYVHKLMDAGVYTVGVRVLGAIHAFIDAPVPETSQYRTALNTIAQFLRDQLKI